MSWDSWGHGQKRALTERENMDRIADLARQVGWRVKHDRPGQTKGSWRTAVTYDGQGWPDLFAVHQSGDVLARELKTWATRKKLGPGQADWLSYLTHAGIDCGYDEPERDQPLGVWTERDWHDIIVPRLLRPTTASPALLARTAAFMERTDPSRRQAHLPVTLSEDGMFYTHRTP